MARAFVHEPPLPTTKKDSVRDRIEKILTSMEVGDEIVVKSSRSYVDATVRREQSWKNVTKEFKLKSVNKTNTSILRVK